MTIKFEELPRSNIRILALIQMCNSVTTTIQTWRNEQSSTFDNRQKKHMAQAETKIREAIQCLERAKVVTLNELSSAENANTKR